jgi:myo-inositol-1(or 4)-monophosphatase
MADELPFALETARQAGRLLCELFSQHHTVHRKSTEIDLVTEADLASERLIVDAIRTRFPSHTILAEEGFGDVAMGSSENLQEAAEEIPHLWIVDPLDGTINYAHGYPVWGVTLALAERGQVVLGVNYDPLLDEMFWAERGQGAWFNGERIEVSTVSRLQDALVATGFAYRRATLANASRGEVPGNNLAEFSAVMPRVQGVRRAGAAVLDLGYLAAGRLDAYWEMYLHPWDWAAGKLIVEEAGGVVTNMRGEPWSLGTNNLVASNGLVHDELLKALREAQVSGDQ